MCCDLLMRRRTLLLGGLGAAVTLPFLARRLLESSIFFAWRRQDQAALDAFARIDADNSHGHHRGIALLADAQGLTLLGSTRRGREQGWLLRLSMTGDLLWEQKMPELDDPGLLVADGEGYLLAGSHQDSRTNRSYSAIVQRVDRNGVSVSTRIHPPGGVSTFLALAEREGRRYLAGASGHKGRLAELRPDLSLAWDREIPELFQISCLIPCAAGLLGLGATEYNTRGPHAGRILLIDPEGRIERSVPASPQGFGHLSRAVHLADGRIIAVGKRQEKEAGPIHGWIVELSEQGVTRKQSLFGSDLTAVTALPGGGYAVAGIALGETDPTRRQVVIRRCLPEHPVREVRLGLEAGVWVYDMVARSDGSLVLLGITTRLGAGKTNLWVARVGANDTVVWERGFGTA